MDPVTLLLLALAVVVVLALLASAVRVVREYERAVVFRLGRFIGVKGPGIVLLIPGVDKATIVDLRVQTIDVPKQFVITRDNVSVEVDAVVYFRVVDPARAVLRVQNYRYAVSRLSMTILRDVLGQATLDDLLQRREELNKRIQDELDRMTDPWGIKVTAVTIKDVVLPEELVRAMAKEAEAERWRRAKVIEAEGERQAARILEEAARVYEEHPVALRLRELQALIEIAKERNMIVIAPATLGVEGALATAALRSLQRGGGGS